MCVRLKRKTRSSESSEAPASRPSNGPSVFLWVVPNALRGQEGGLWGHRCLAGKGSSRPSEGPGMEVAEVVSGSEETPGLTTRFGVSKVQRARPDEGACHRVEGRTLHSV